MRSTTLYLENNLKVVRNDYCSSSLLFGVPTELEVLPILMHVAAKSLSEIQTATPS
jgi:hypothetical protein